MQLCDCHARRKTTLMGGIEMLIKILSDPDPELELLAAETMANLAKFRNARTVVRKNGGIPKLIDLLDIDMTKVNHQGSPFFLTSLMTIDFRVLFESCRRNLKAWEQTNCPG